LAMASSGDAIFFCFRGPGGGESREEKAYKGGVKF